ncbi:hypothetical protein DFP72DRAFT_903592 [Ephemerocybe angulata]|uniref:BTB domain-containing protein n=1 Tax=Ephemerocybe angulata TaxID=980116 RepID=A0A8H6M345_9AGAR|nr:hypothetical protein DFP72DRAFT_903592 [Tulosesus angulatus]
MDNSTSVAAEHVEHDAPPCAGRNYYYELVTFKVEDKLYRVPRHGFSQFSIVFESMFSLPQADGTAEGQTDDHPIQLLCASRDFEALLDLLYPQPQIQQREMTKDGWVSVLKLSTQWAMDEARKAAIEKLSEVKLPVLEKVTLAKEYNVAPWLLDGYTDLVQHWGSPSSPSLQDIGTALGWETAARILEVVVKAKGASGAVTTAAFTCPNIHCGIHNSRKYTSGYMPLTLSCAACGTTIVKVTSDDLSTLFESRDRFAEAVRAAFKEELDFMY